MKMPFDDAMRAATELTKRGSLIEATQMIQEALGAGTPHAAGRSSPARTPHRQVLPGGRTTELEPVGDAHRFLEGEVAFQGLVRSYKLFVPSTSSASPGLVVMLHGCTQTPDDFAAGTRANDAAIDADCLVLYPAQSARANANRCWNWFEKSHQSRDRGEAGLLAHVTEEVIADHGVDPRRVFVAGLSAGGAMAAVLASEYPDVYAAACIHSGLPAGAASDLPQALQAMRSGPATSGLSTTGDRDSACVPTIVFHGEQDHTVHATNADASVFSVLNAASQSTLDAPQVVELTDAKGRRVTRTCYRSHGRTLVEKWTVRSGGHAWFGGSPTGSYTDQHGVDATREMFRFFAESPRAGTA